MRLASMANRIFISRPEIGAAWSMRVVELDQEVVAALAEAEFQSGDLGK
jgi:hypothetical protein